MKNPTPIKTTEFVIIDLVTGEFHVTPFKSVMCKFIGMHTTSLYRNAKKKPGYLNRFSYRNFVIIKAKKIHGGPIE